MKKGEGGILDLSLRVHIISGQYQDGGGGAKADDDVSIICHHGRHPELLRPQALPAGKLVFQEGIIR